MMSSILNDVLNICKSDDLTDQEKGFCDLRLIIERYTQNRYDSKSIGEYRILFYNQEYLNIKLNNKEYEMIKHFLFYAILNYDIKISPLIAKCIKVLYDEEIIEAICRLIEYFVDKNDLTTDFLILSINNMFSDGSQFNNERIMDTYKMALKYGGDLSKERIAYIFNFYKNNYDNTFSW